MKCFKGKERHFLSLLWLLPGSLLEDKLGTCVFLLSPCYGNCNIHEISSDFFSQSCLYLTYSRTVKGTDNSTHVQISLIDLPDETRKGIRVLAVKIKTRDNIENSRPLLLKAYKSGNTFNYAPHQVLLFLLLTGAGAYAASFLLLFLATYQAAPVNLIHPVYCSKWILSCQV